MKIVMLAQAGSAHTHRWGAALARRGHRIHLITNSSLTVSPDGIETTFLPGSSSFAYLRNIPRARRLMRSLIPDIVHAHFATGYGLWGSFQDCAPLILTVWGSDVEDAHNGRFGVSWVVRRALQKACFVTAPSRFLMDRTIDFEPSAADKIRLIPFGVSVPDDPPVSPSPKEFGIIRLIFAKAYQATYAPELAIEAFAAAFRENPRLRLTMIGGGPLKAQLQNQAAAAGLAEVIAIHDRLSPEDALKRIKESDLMLMPSRRESFGVAALEAAAFAVPVIATRIGGIPEVVQNEATGILIPPGDVGALTNAILRLAGDDGLRAKMGRAGYEFVKKRFELAVCVTQMEALYRQAMVG